MNQLTESQIAQQYVMNAYPCIQRWMDFMTAITPYTQKYDSISCNQISLIGKSAMKTFDYIYANESNSSVIRVSRMILSMHSTAWTAWTTFKAQSRIATGTKSIDMTPTSIQAISTFESWDGALNPSPTHFNPPSLLDKILKEVVV